MYRYVKYNLVFNNFLNIVKILMKVLSILHNRVIEVPNQSVNKIIFPQGWVITPPIANTFYLPSKNKIMNYRKNEMDKLQMTKHS